MEFDFRMVELVIIAIALYAFIVWYPPGDGGRRCA